jgi:hypothetical protein
VVAGQVRTILASVAPEKLLVSPSVPLANVA